MLHDCQYRSHCETTPIQRRKYFNRFQVGSRDYLILFFLQIFIHCLHQWILRSFVFGVNHRVKKNFTQSLCVIIIIIISWTHIPSFSFLSHVGPALSHWWYQSLNHSCYLPIQKEPELWRQSQQEWRGKYASVNSREVPGRPCVSQTLCLFFTSTHWASHQTDREGMGGRNGRVGNSGATDQIPGLFKPRLWNLRMTADPWPLLKVCLLQNKSSNSSNNPSAIFNWDYITSGNSQTMALCWESVYRTRKDKTSTQTSVYG